MKRLACFIAILLSFYCSPPPAICDPGVSVFFSPNGGCTEAVLKALAEAKVSVQVQAYSFTSSPIAKALVDASRRGVAVQVILDESNRTAKYSSADFLLHANIPTMIDASHAIAHNKVMIVDGETVITGSFNFSKAAEENNAENLLLIRSKEIAAKYLENWKEHATHSEVYKGRESGAGPKEKPGEATAGAPQTGLPNRKAAMGNFHGNRSSKVFHAPGCKAYDCEKCTESFGSREEAIKAGYKPCGSCKP